MQKLEMKPVALSLKASCLRQVNYYCCPDHYASDWRTFSDGELDWQPMRKSRLGEPIRPAIRKRAYLPARDGTARQQPKTA
jgi:hypothetical protein